MDLEKYGYWKIKVSTSMKGSKAQKQNKAESKTLVETLMDNKPFRWNWMEIT